MPCNAYDDMAVLVFKHPGCYNPPLAMAEGGATDLVVDRATPAAAARGAGGSPAAIGGDGRRPGGLVGGLFCETNGLFGAWGFGP